MAKSGTNTKSNKNTPKAPKAKDVNESVKNVNLLTKEEKDLVIKLIETAEYYQDYMLTDFDRKVIRDIKRKIVNEATK
jgi:hypothetical protein